MSDCLHCDINDLVGKTERDDADLGDLAARLTEAWPIYGSGTQAPPADQSGLMNDVLANLGRSLSGKDWGYQSPRRH